MVFDIETVAIDGAAELADAISAPANYKDPEKIAAYIIEARRAQLERASLYPWTARIVALGTIDMTDVEEVSICPSEVEERQAIDRFWQRATYSDVGIEVLRPLVGFNVLKFDLPVLMARSRLLGVRYPKVDLTPWKSKHVVDLAWELTFGQPREIQLRSLKWFAKRFDLPSDDTVSGADIAGLVAAGNWDAVRAHCLSDIRTTKALAERLGVIKGGRVAA